MDPIDINDEVVNIHLIEINHIRNYENVKSIQKPMLHWLEIDQYDLHFIKSGHICATESLQGKFEILWSICYPNISIRIHKVDTRELLNLINSIHRIYMKDRNANVTCPVCGIVTFDDSLEPSVTRQRLRL